MSAGKQQTVYTAIEAWFEEQTGMVLANYFDVMGLSSTKRMRPGRNHGARINH